jgi:hypothetical protein
MKILAIDLGKYKSVACSYVTATGTARFATVVTHVLELDRLLLRESPAQQQLHGEHHPLLPGDRRPASAV